MKFEMDSKSSDLGIDLQGQIGLETCKFLVLIFLKLIVKNLTFKVKLAFKLPEFLFLLFRIEPFQNLASDYYCLLILMVYLWV